MKPFLRAAHSILAICLLSSLTCIRQPAASNDPDRDGLADADEAIFGSNPQVFDSDGDGVGDALEVLQSTDPNAAASRLASFPDGAAECLLYNASHDASGLWTLSALGCGFSTFALLGRPNGGGPFGLAFDAHGFLYAARGRDLVRIDPFSGAIDRSVELRDAAGAPVVVMEIAWGTEDMTLYGVERTAEMAFGPGRQIVRIDPGSGLTTRIGAPLPAAVHAIASMPPGSSLHATPGTVLQAAVESDPEADALLRIEVQDLATPLAPPTGTPWMPEGWVATGFLIGGEPDPLILSRTTGASTGEIFGHASYHGSWPRALGAIARPPPCPAPCFEVEPYMLPGDGSYSSLESGDLDGDGDLDLVVYDQSDPAIDVLLNDGDGQFALSSSHPTVPFALFQDFLLLTDLDADGALDAVLATWTAEVLYGDGNGGFEAPVEWPIDNLSALAVGDVTGDGLADLVAGSNANVVFRANLGDRTFAPPVAFSLAPGVRDLVLLRNAANAAHDVAALTFDDALVVLDNDGSGGLTETARLAYGAETVLAYRFGAGDLDRDGIDDVVLPIETGGIGFVDIHPHPASGGLGAVTRIPFGQPNRVGPGFARPVVADATNDGRNDLLVADQFGDLLVLIGDGSGVMHHALSPSERKAWGGRYDLSIGDFDGNGIADPMLLRFNLQYFPSRSPYAPTP